MPILATPLALAALAALPAAAAIYLLRSRHRRRIVSALFLWSTIDKARGGGTRVDRIQTPLLLLLELMILAALALAASGPRVWSVSGRTPMAVVLDDSISMRAGGDDSARVRAMKWIEDEAESGRWSIRLIAAGPQPRMLSDIVEDRAAARRVLEQWQAQSAQADLPKAAAMAADLAGPGGRVVLLTDHAPPESDGMRRWHWRAFGRPLGNLAIVAAERVDDDQDTRLMLQIANLSEDARSAELIIDQPSASGPMPSALRRQEVNLAAGQTSTLRVGLSGMPDQLRIRLQHADALDADNQALLLPQRRRIVRIACALADPGLSAAVARALSAVQGAAVVADSPHLWITDGPPPAASPDQWVFQFISAEPISTFSGPFVLDRDHPLIEGMSLAGVIWSAPAGLPPAGRPLIAVGNTPLLAVEQIGSSRRDVRCYFRPERSTLAQSPDWPILFYNLTAWRSRFLPGLSQRNLRLGQSASLSIAATAPVRWVSPQGVEREWPAVSSLLTLPGESLGVHRVRWGESSDAFAVNLLNLAESDLGGRSSGSWGDDSGARTMEWAYRPIAWPLLLAALGVMTLHGWLLHRAARHSGGGAES
jgi:hypothetical protein